MKNLFLLSRLVVQQVGFGEHKNKKIYIFCEGVDLVITVEH